MSKGNSTEKPAKWEAELETRLPLYGHRNWIVIADSAYPAHANAGIEAIFAEGNHLDVLETVLRRIGAHAHLCVQAHTDLELQFVSENDAPGVANLRHGLEVLLGSSHPKATPHEELIAKLDQSARTFRILIVKTGLAIPYSSIFLELGCGYWNPQAEQRMRQSMGAAQPSTGKRRSDGR